MASAFLTIPTKKTWDADMTRSLRAFIADVYCDLHPADYNYAIAEFNKLRSNVAAKLSDKTEAALETLCRYYDQLVAIEGKLPIAENQIRINFIWQDAFSKKTKTIASAAYERACVLFSIAAMQTHVASAQSLSTDDGLKAAAKLLQQASGIFAHLVTTMPTTLPSPPTMDLSADVLNALSGLTLAEAQECFVRKAITDNMKPLIIAKLSSQCSQLYTDALRLLQLETLKNVWPKDWVGGVACRQNVFQAVAQYQQSLVDREAKKYGEWLGRLRVARDRMASAEKLGAGGSFVYSEYQKTIAADLQVAEKENGMIYHLRVPDGASLAPVDKAVVAKPSLVGSPLSVSFNDLFGNVVPMVVMNAVATYEARKSEIVYHEIGRLRDATRALNTLLISYNLPAAIEDLSGESVPHSLLAKAASIRQLGGIGYLDRIMTDLPQLLQRNKDIVDQAERELSEEEASDRQLRAQFGGNWQRTPSEALNAPIRQELMKYRTIIGNALSADALVRQRFATHRNNIALLSQPDTDIERSLPSGSPVSAMQGSPIINTIRQLVDEAQAIKEGRDTIENQLKDAKCDMVNKFLTALHQDGALNEAALCSQQLDRVYGPVREQVAQSLKRQEVITKQLQQSYGEFNRAKAQNPGSLGREKQLRDLAMAYDSFADLKSNVEDGTRFYNELTQLLVRFQAKVSDFCGARRAEKDELMKDLSANIARQPSSPQPQIPTYQQPSPFQVPTYQQPHMHMGGASARGVNTIHIGGGQPMNAGMATNNNVYHSASFFMPSMPSVYNPYAQM